MATNPDLPNEILVEIFSRLPTKSVGKFRCLSKYWGRELSSTHFMKKHLMIRQQTPDQENLVLVTTDEELHLVTSPLKNKEQLKICLGEWSNQLPGACNGLVLLMPRDSVNFLVVNPITLQQVAIRKPEQPWKDLSGNRYARVYGFGYDSVNDDFKVIVIHSSFIYEEWEYNVFYDSETLVDVFSLRRGVWNRLPTNVYPYERLIPSLSARRHGAFLNGAVHWLICDNNNGYYRYIAAFDLAKEVFYLIPLPAQFDRNRPRPGGVMCMDDYTGIAVIGGCLSIVANLSNRSTVSHPSYDYGNGVHVWMMKEYRVPESWVRFEIEGYQLDHSYGLSIIPLFLVRDEELMCYTDRDVLVVCDLRDGETEKVIVGGHDTWYWGGIAFVDSLISPHTYIPQMRQ